jgi:hypothetical protein
MSKGKVTNIYKIQHAEGIEWLLPVNERDYEMLILDGRPRGSSWKPVMMTRLKDYGDGTLVRPSDFPCGAGGGTYLTMSDAAKQKIGASLKGYGEFLPFKCDEGNFWAFHVTNFVDALDKEASEVLRAPDDPNVILMIHKHVFRPEKLTTDWMFKLPYARGRSDIYVTDAFVNLIRTSELTGLNFKRVWPHS